MTIAVLAVQGAFAEHEKKLDELGISWFELRKKEDLDRHYDGLILPGGESTVQGKLLKELGMFERLKGQIEKGLPQAVALQSAGQGLGCEIIGEKKLHPLKALIRRRAEAVGEGKLREHHGQVGGKNGHDLSLAAWTGRAGLLTRLPKGNRVLRGRVQAMRI